MITQSLSINGLLILATLAANIASAENIRQLPAPMQKRSESLLAPAAQRMIHDEPNAKISFTPTNPASATFDKIPATIQVNAEQVSRQGYLTLDPQSRVWISVKGNNAPLPNGRYLVRANISNVGNTSTLVMEGAGMSGNCPLRALPGYRNIQACDLIVTATNSAELVVSLRTQPPPAAFSQATLESVHVFKVQ